MALRFGPTGVEGKGDGKTKATPEGGLCPAPLLLAQAKKERGDCLIPACTIAVLRPSAVHKLKKGDSMAWSRPAFKDRTYLRVPFTEKDEARKRGAHWDPMRKFWYYETAVNDHQLFWRWPVVLVNESPPNTGYACAVCGISVTHKRGVTLCEDHQATKHTQNAYAPTSRDPAARWLRAKGRHPK